MQQLSKHKVAGMILETVNVFEKASALSSQGLSEKYAHMLNTVCVVNVNSDGLEDIIDSESAGELFNNHKSKNQDFDISLACECFPSISFGHCPPMELYDGANCGRVESALLAAKISEEVFPCCIDAKLVDSDFIYEACTSLYQGESSRHLSMTFTSHPTEWNDKLLEVVIDANIIFPLVNYLEHTEFEINKEAARAISNATSGGTHDRHTVHIMESHKVVRSEESSTSSSNELEAPNTCLPTFNTAGSLNDGDTVADDMSLKDLKVSLEIHQFMRIAMMTMKMTRMTESSLTLKVGFLTPH
ncbi:hypothetical protein M9H77_30270 [Catharanthus roseus]|uniref:Uncharacterized protein n=1 Tax=Catharanthus roseus TaxID=4058 RepID=A0ACB9ZWS0_CATRO|nr:hypothetical protein M9H77_30270 [Catharanthus roseus]